MIIYFVETQLKNIFSFQTAFAMEQEEQPSFRRYVEDRRYYEVPARFAMHTAYMEVPNMQ